MTSSFRPNDVERQTLLLNLSGMEKHRRPPPVTNNKNASLNNFSTPLFVSRRPRHNKGTIDHAQEDPQRYVP